MDKKYNTTIAYRTPRPRSKRAQATGAAASSGSSVTVTVGAAATAQGTGSTGDGHTHANKGYLDQITTDTEGYLNLTQSREVADGTGYEAVTDKVRAGHADTARDLDADSPVYDKVLSSVEADTAQGLITLAAGLRAGSYVAGLAGASIDAAGKAEVAGVDSRGAVKAAELRTSSYIEGAAGAAVDAAGNAEVESIKVRSRMEVMELILNRLNCQEGDTRFSESGIVEAVADGADDIKIITLRPRWEGDTLNPFRRGDIIYGYVNDLASGGTTYQRVFARATDVADDTVHITYYPGDACPGGSNGTFQRGMVIARWGNTIEPTEANLADPRCSFLERDAQGVIYNPRQQSWMVSTDEGSIQLLQGVSTPRLSAANYGAVFGQLPAGLLDSDTEALTEPSLPYLYAKGVLVENLIRVDYDGKPAPEMHYRGAWDSASTYRATATLYDAVSHCGKLWRCLSTTATSAEPGTDTAAWSAMTDTAAQVVISPESLTINTSRGTGIGFIYVDAFLSGTQLDYSADYAVATWDSIPEGLRSVSFTVIPATDTTPRRFRLNVRWDTDSEATQAVLPITVTVGSETYQRYATITPVADGAAGEAGATGAVVRGPRDWESLPLGEQFQCGDVAAGEQFLDVVVYSGQYYLCTTSHTKTTVRIPSAAPQWSMAVQWDMVATKLLLSEYALIKNLGVEHVDIKDASNNVVFHADAAGLTCNTGTFTDVSVKGSLTAKELSLSGQNSTDDAGNTVIDGAFLLISQSDSSASSTYILPQLAAGTTRSVEVMVAACAGSVTFEGDGDSTYIQSPPNSGDGYVPTPRNSVRVTALPWGLYKLVGVGYSPTVTHWFWYRYATFDLYNYLT